MKMRYLMAFGRYGILAVALCVIMGLMILSGGLARAENPFAYPTYTARTCSGSIAAAGTQVFVFGFRGIEKACSTRVMYASSYEEALECAKAACPSCEIEDITGFFHYGTRAGEKDPFVEYCKQK